MIYMVTNQWQSYRGAWSRAAAPWRQKGPVEWADHLISMPPETPLMMFQARPTGRRPWGSPGLTGQTPIWPGSALLSS